MTTPSSPSDNWAELPLSEAVQINPSIGLKRGEVYPFVDMASVNGIQRTVNAMEEREFKGSGSKFQHGDTLMARITPCLENGKIAQYKALQDQQQAYGSTEFIVLRGRLDTTTDDFVYYLTRWEEVRQYAIGQMTGTSGRQRVPVDSLDHLTVPVPPIPVQRRVAGILGALDGKIELNRRMNETLQQMARALYKSWFVDFGPVRAKMDGRWHRGESLIGFPAGLYDLLPDRLVPSELGEIPEGWEVKALRDYLELAYGKSLRADARRLGNVPVLGSNGQVGWHDQRLVAGPGIVVGRKGNPGTVAWSQRNFFPIDTTFYVVPRTDHLNLHFLRYALADQDLPSIAADSAVPGLNRNLVYMNRQLVPDKIIVDEFVNYASVLFERISRFEDESRALFATRNALLPRLVSGELRVMEK